LDYGNPHLYHIHYNPQEYCVPLIFKIYLYQDVDQQIQWHHKLYPHISIRFFHVFQPKIVQLLHPQIRDQQIPKKHLYPSYIYILLITIIIPIILNFPILTINLTHNPQFIFSFNNFQVPFL